MEVGMENERTQGVDNYTVSHLCGFCKLCTGLQGGGRKVVGWKTCREKN